MTFLPEALDVKRDGLTNEPQGFISCLPGCDTPRKVGDIGSERCGALLDHDEVSHIEILLLLLEARLLQHAVECPWRQIDA